MTEIKAWWISGTTFAVARGTEMVKSTDLTEAERGEVINKFLTCAKCGNGSFSNKEGLRYLEDIVCYREVLGTKDTGDGKLHIEGMYYTGEGYDDGTNHRIECRGCHHEWPVPEWMEPWLEFA